MIVSFVSLTFLPNLSQPGISEVALASQKTTEIFLNAFFFDQLLSRALESGDALSALYLLTSTSQPDGDPMVVTTLPDE